MSQRSGFKGCEREFRKGVEAAGFFLEVQCSGKHYIQANFQTRFAVENNLSTLSLYRSICTDQEHAVALFALHHNVVIPVLMPSNIRQGAFIDHVNFSVARFAFGMITEKLEQCISLADSKQS